MAVTPGAILGAAGLNAATSGGTSAGGSSGASSSYSRTNGTAATQAAQQAAATANSAANAAWEKAAAYNAEQAQINREWQERMANTVYQRTVKDMIKAGINPVLAADMGLGTASVNSGATASMGNPMSYMSNTYADSESASQSKNSSWNESMSGLAYLADAIGNAITAMNSSHNISIAIDGLKDLIHKDVNGDGETKADESIANIVSEFSGKTPAQVLDMFMSDSSNKRKALYNTNNKNVPGTKNYQPQTYRINEPSWVK